MTTSIPGLVTLPPTTTIKSLAEKEVGEGKLPDTFGLLVIKDEKAFSDHLDKLGKEKGWNTEVINEKKKLASLMGKLQQGHLKSGDGEDIRSTLRDLIEKKGDSASEWMKMLARSLAPAVDEIGDKIDEESINKFILKATSTIH